jgi:hypothetical protein
LNPCFSVNSCILFKILYFFRGHIYYIIEISLAKVYFFCFNKGLIKYNFLTIMLF